MTSEVRYVGQNSPRRRPVSQTWFCLFVPSCPEHWHYSMAWSVSPALARVHLLVAHTESFAGEEGTVWRDCHSD